MTEGPSSEDALAVWAAWPIWGFAVAGIFLTYNLVGATDGEGLPDAAVGWLWAPWILAGIVIVQLVSGAMGAQGFDPRDRRAWIGSLAGTAVIVVSELVIARLPFPDGPNASNLVLAGAIAAALSVLQRVQGRGSPWPGLVGGGLVGAVGIVLPFLAGAEAVRGLLAAATVVVGFGAIGAWGMRTHRDET